MEWSSNYDIDIQYYPRRANKAVDALSQKTYDTLIVMKRLPGELAKEIKDAEIIIVHDSMANLKLKNSTRKLRKVNLRSHQMVQCGLKGQFTCER